MKLLSSHISQERLWNRHLELAKIGATETGGMDRQALTDEDNQARLLVMKWANALGAKTEIDAIGNLFLRLPGTNPDLPAIATGSHLDTQPSGGMFDGIYGVLAGLEVMEAIHASGQPLARSLDVIIWMNEEGSRFSPATMGSGVYCGDLELESILSQTDSDDILLSDALDSMKAALGDIKLQQSPSSYSGYIEAHIEQGPVLEKSHTTIGAVSSIQGLRQYEIVVSGQAAHAGTTPNKERQDALMSAISIINDISHQINDDEDRVRFTVGSFDVTPGSPNTIPSKVVFSIDLRHPENQRLDEIEKIIYQAVSDSKVCTAKVNCLIRSAVTNFDDSIVNLIADSAKMLDFSVITLPSGATHDAKSMAKLCPSAMIFIPCKDGISHNEAEWAESEHLYAGASVLADVISAISNA